MNVKNKRCIRNLSRKQLKAAKTRNLIAIFAIALTTLLFTSLFTIAFSLNASYEEYTFRQIGGYNHGTFKEVTDENVEAISNHKKIKAYGLRTVIGFIAETPFAKKPAEISWMDANTAKWSYAVPTTGHIPEAGMEIAMDTEALKKLGIPAELGQQVALTYSVASKDGSIADSKARTDVFTLVGFWEYDSLMPVHYINISEAYLRQIEADYIADDDEGFRTDMNVMLASSLNIQGIMESVDTDLGYQWEDHDAPNCVRIGTNWGYSTTELSTSMDPTAIAAIAAFLILVIFTGYLIIYNIFQISVSNDIRFYGLLKTIGTTPRQLKRIVRNQAIYLCIAGIPIGLLAGYGVGILLTPFIMSISSIGAVKHSASPVIFLGSALFSLLTVWLSCARPGRKAARITPVEAVRYTENMTVSKKKRATRGAGIRQMALANMSRNRMKTGLVILSLSLAVVLLNCVFTFTNGFDMEKYVNSFSVSDFVVGTPEYFRFRGSDINAEISDEHLDAIRSSTDASLGGTAYAVSGVWPQGWLSETEYSIVSGLSSETMRMRAQQSLKRDGLFACEVLLEGLDDALLEKLQVYDGDLAPLKDLTQHAIALGANLDDNGELHGSTPKHVGDTLTITYIDEGVYYDSRTDELCTEDTPEEYRAVKTHDLTYTVCALVGIPYGMSYRFSINPGFDAILTGDALRQDYGEEIHRMFYMFDTPDATAEASAENFLADYTAGEDSELMYESKAQLRADFNNFRTMFLLVGTVLCIIVGFVGILNFFNAVLTGILTRHREFAMLQSVGMTGRQLKQMLVYEGIFYAAGAGLVTLALSLVLNPLAGKLLEQLFWFFSYHFTILPALVIIPVFILMGVTLPLIIYRFTRKKSIVERLREVE